MILKPNWIVPSSIQAAYTLRAGGVSLEPYSSFNLGNHVEDNPSHVAQNRALLKQKLALKNEPAWLTQVHGSEILNLDLHPSFVPTQKLEYDASFTTQADRACVIMTADCLPILLCDESGLAIAALHCGWRSMAAGLIQKSIALFKIHSTAPIIVWLGPCIGPNAFEVGEDVRLQFKDQKAFIPLSKNKYLGDLHQIARGLLLDEGVLAKNIYQNPECTYSNSNDFYSFRRDTITGRMASLIWKHYLE